jgi:hypothetical protein
MVQYIVMLIPEICSELALHLYILDCGPHLWTHKIHIQCYKKDHQQYPYLVTIEIVRFVIYRDVVTVEYTG